MENNSKPACRFGVKCYRKNPTHFKMYFHPTKAKIKKSRNLKVPSQSRTLKKTKNDIDKEINNDEKTNFPIQKKRKEIITDTQKKCKFTKQLSSDLSDGEGSNIPVKLEDGLIDSSNLIQKSFEDSNQCNNKEVAADLIKELFLVKMPVDFFCFYEFYKSLDSKVFQCSGLKLVGPFDVFYRKINFSKFKEMSLLHWRFYYDPPEFQTVLASESEYHIGYWRDDPDDYPVFLASNTADKDCIFKKESDNIFGAVFHYLKDLEKTSDPFKKIKIKNLQTMLSDWAQKNNFSLEKTSKEMVSRDKKVVSNTFHKAGIVVPVEPKTGVGYRPLIETEVKIKKLCNQIMVADVKRKESLWENLQPLITAANIANDECDFGNSLELGINLFCMGSPDFHDTVEHLLTTAYSLLNRNVFEKIIRIHLKNRRKGNKLSML